MVLIVGGGLAAQRAAETLRARDHRGPIRVVCGEPVAPYDRPPLSKELRAEPFRPPDWYAENDVELLLGRRAARLDVAGRRVVLEDGVELGYDELIVATGAHPRRLPIFAGRPNVHVLRTLADTDALRDALAPGARLAIVGAGFIGQEVASTARGLGVEVTLIEAADVPLAHILGARLGGWFADLHREEGVRVELGVTVADAGPAGAPVERLVLSDGRTIVGRRGAGRRRRRGRDALARRFAARERRRGRRRRPYGRAPRLRRRRRDRRPALGAWRRGSAPPPRARSSDCPPLWPRPRTCGATSTAFASTWSASQAPMSRSTAISRRATSPLS